MMDVSQRLAVLRSTLPEVTFEEIPSVDQPCLAVPREAIVDVCRTLREHGALQFQVLAEMTAVDVWPREPRFEVVYHFVSLGPAAMGDAPPPARLRLKVRVPGSDPALATISSVYPNANWYEREVWDLFGVIFTGHPDLRRILMPDEWEGHPARKDYPVQVKLPVNVSMPLQVTEEEFLRTIEEQRARSGSGVKG
ncbi:MAG: NADH-quinone oxidoreductase subunit C [Luteitalea sp.]|nr:NADH-quinone oxidoreductase subunit C [Luteitalea sp.]